MARLLLWCTVFGVAFGFIEGAVVVYLREIAYPQGFQFPLEEVDQKLLTTEVVREGATLVLILAVACLAVTGGPTETPSTRTSTPAGSVRTTTVRAFGTSFSSNSLSRSGAIVTATSSGSNPSRSTRTTCSPASTVRRPSESRAATRPSTKIVASGGSIRGTSRPIISARTLSNRARALLGVRDSSGAYRRACRAAALSHRFG